MIDRAEGRNPTAMRLGILGGTFDPIHFGHLFIAEEARCSHSLNRVLFLPNGRPPHKESDGLTTASHRLEMTRIATKTNSNFLCSSIETDRTEVSYTVDALKTIQEAYAGSELFYIAGVDAIAELMTWKEPEKVIELTRFLAVTRPGYDLELLKKKLPETYLERIGILETDSPDISSSVIRARLNSGLTVRYLLPEAVLDYIEKHRLYR